MMTGPEREREREKRGGGGGGGGREREKRERERERESRSRTVRARSDVLRDLLNNGEAKRRASCRSPGSGTVREKEREIQRDRFPDGDSLTHTLALSSSFSHVRDRGRREERGGGGGGGGDRRKILLPWQSLTLSLLSSYVRDSGRRERGGEGGRGGREEEEIYGSEAASTSFLLRKAACSTRRWMSVGS